MQRNSSESGKLSPFMLQSAIGLTIVVSVGILGGVLMWLTNFTFGGRSFRATLLFPNAGGMTVGTRVAYRGVKIGQIVSVTPEPEGVSLEVEIRPADRLIPANSTIEATQGGLVGETSIDIIPLQPLPPDGVKAKPLDPNCDQNIIICNGSRLQGEGKLDVNTLIRSLVRIANIISEPEVTSAMRTLFQKSSDALGKFSSLSENTNLLLKEMNNADTIDNLNSTLSSLNSLSNQADGLITEAKSEGTIYNLNSTFDNLNSTLNSVKSLSEEANGVLTEAQAQDTINQLNSTLNSLELAGEQIQVFMTVNQGQIATTVASVGQTSKDLSATLQRLDPIVKKIDEGQFVSNLESISTNAADLTANLRDLSSKLSDPATIVQLQQLLDSARSVFENVNKITSDVDELTGDPQLRQDLIRMIQGLSNLVSSTQQLQQQVQYAQILNQVAMEINRPPLSNQTNPSSVQSTTSPKKP